MFERRALPTPPDTVNDGSGYGQPGMGWWDTGMVWKPGAAMSTGEAMRLSAVFACLRLLSEAISTLPIDTFRRQGGVRTVYRRRLAELEESSGVEARDARAAELEAEWAAESQPWEAAANIILDDVIDPRDTRATILEGIDFAWGTRARVSREGLG